MCASARIERPDFISKRNKKDMLLKKLLFGKNRLVTVSMNRGILKKNRI